jgi:hypothetical protein
MNQLRERYLEDFTVGQTFGSGRVESIAPVLPTFVFRRVRFCWVFVLTTQIGNR